jgi:glycosyltransferase involved in cell wall biosynthesis
MINTKLSIVLPCYNEANNLTSILANLRLTIKNRKDVEVIVVNNGSRDNSAAVLARELSDPTLWFIRVEHVGVNQGYGFGIMAGLRVAKGEFLAWTHADMQTDPADVLRGYEKILAARDPQNAFVKGGRVARGPLDSFFTFGMSLISSAFLGCWMHDINAQPKIFSRNFYTKLESPPDDFSLDLYAYYLAKRSGGEVMILPVDFGKRRHGDAKGGGSISGKLRLSLRTWKYIIKIRREILNKSR